MRFLLATLGTAGDVFPFVAIGRALRARGHRVELLTNPVFADAAHAAGLEFHPVGTAAQFEATYSHHFAWHPINSLGVMWRHLARPALRPAYERIAAVHAEEPCCVVYSPFLMPAPRIAREALGVRALTAYTSPAMIRSCVAPVVVARWALPAITPRWACALAWRALDRIKLQPLALPDIETQRGPLGLEPLRESVFGSWLHSPDGGIALFPRWFAAPQADWPRNLASADFPLHDSDQGAGIDARTAAFLAAGAPPLVFLTGSAMRQSAGLFAAAVAATTQLGRRAILLTQNPADVPPALPEGVMHAAYVPLGLLLPRAAALVHHGGIGSSAQALRAGVPQLVVPQAVDQFENALRLRALGVARSLPPERNGVADLAGALRALEADARVATACARVRGLFGAGGGMDAIVDAIEASA